MLAYELVSNGVDVRVLERHPDFQREFRGELFQASVVEQLERAGILKLLVVAIRDTLVAANQLVPLLQGDAAIDFSVFEAIQNERMPEIQAGQTRAGQMVLKPLPVLHLMFTMPGAAMVFLGKKLQAGHGIAPPVPRYLTPVPRA